MSSVPELRFPEFSGDWEEKVLNKLGILGKTYSFSRNQEGDGDYHHIHYGDIHSKFHGIIDANTKVPSIRKSSNYETLKDGDIVIADASEDYKDLGKTLIIKDTDNRKIIAGLHTFKFTPYINLNPFFYLYYSQSGTYKRFIQRVGTGISVLGISKTNISKMNFFVPSIKEQEKIAKFLSALDTRIEAQEKIIESIEEMKKGYMQKIFSREIRFKDENGENYPEWEDKRLEEMVELIPSSLTSTDSVPDGQYSLFDVNSKIGNTTMKVGSPYITIIKDGAGVGRIRLLEPDSYFTGTMNGFISDTENIRFIYYLLNLMNFKKYIVGSGIPHIYFKDYKIEKFKTPSLPEQQKIANFLSTFDRKLETEAQILETLKDIKKGLLQQMFV